MSRLVAGRTFDAMARQARKELRDGLVHVTCRTVRAFPLFLTERDASFYVALLAHVTRDLVQWRILAYCLMPNHIHLVVDTRVQALSLAMHRINGIYAQRFNREHGYRGHLFQGRFHAKPIDEEAHLPGSMRYVVLNPVRAGLCRHPKNWRWSSYRACAGLEPAPAFLDVEHALSVFGPGEARARPAFCAFVEECAAESPQRGQSPGLSPLGAARASG